MKTVINTLNYEENRTYHGQKITQPSMTVPDQTLSLREIVNRFARGLPVPNGKEPVYHGEDEEMPDLRRMDLAEIQELKENLQTFTQQKQAQYDKELSDKKSAWQKKKKEETSLWEMFKAAHKKPSSVETQQDARPSDGRSSIS